MNLITSGLVGLAVGVLVGLRVKKPSKPCEFCGYHDDETTELYEAHELDKLLRENE